MKFISTAAIVTLCTLAPLIPPSGPACAADAGPDGFSSWNAFLIQGGRLVDGTGAKPRNADIRVAGGKILEVGRLNPRPEEKVLLAHGLVVAPGFIDTHSHADGGLMENPTAESQVRQGITTAIVGQDGFSQIPLTRFFTALEQKPTALNIASFVGHGSVRSKVMGTNYRRPATPAETAEMVAMVQAEMEAGALGLSSGLEYDPGLYATTEEVVACAKPAAAAGGMYISHVRDEENEALTSIDEVIRISKAARLPGQISHIKLGSKNVWGKASQVLAQMRRASGKGPAITADIYPYTYWRSTITVITPTRDWADRAAWQKGLDEIGGPANVLLTTYTPNPDWEGKTLAQLVTETGKDAVSLVQEIVNRTRGGGEGAREGVVVTAMREDDVRTFLQAPEIMFCTDGGLRSSHPRSAGTYPRILGHYVRDKKVLSLQEAVRKMTSLPAKTMGLKERGVIAPGARADLVLFDPDTVLDTATTAEPLAPPAGIPTVLVNGVPVLLEGKVTGFLPGQVLRRPTQK